MRWPGYWEARARDDEMSRPSVDSDVEEGVVCCIFAALALWEKNRRRGGPVDPAQTYGHIPQSHSILPVEEDANIINTIPKSSVLKSSGFSAE